MWNLFWVVFNSAMVGRYLQILGSGIDPDYDGHNVVFLCIHLLCLGISASLSVHQGKA